MIIWDEINWKLGLLGHQIETVMGLSSFLQWLIRLFFKSCGYYGMFLKDSKLSVENNTSSAPTWIYNRPTVQIRQPGDDIDSCWCKTGIFFSLRSNNYTEHVKYFIHFNFTKESIRIIHFIPVTREGIFLIGSDHARYIWIISQLIILWNVKNILMIHIFSFNLHQNRF